MILTDFVFKKDKHYFSQFSLKKCKYFENEKVKMKR